MRLFACHGNSDTENIYNGRWTNAAGEASYDCVRPLALYIQVSALDGSVSTVDAL